MKAAVLSGKGGAGKTFVAVNLAVTAGKATYIDCDVEEPNGRLFLKPEKITEQVVTVKVPEFSAEKCTGCRKCVDFCRFNALIYIKNTPKVFPEVCHACGGCSMVCPQNAVTEADRPIGHLELGCRESTRVITGILNPGEASGIGVIRSALQAANQNGLAVIDCPPGSACSVMESIFDADYCILVAEPTAFGFHNFCMVHELAALMGKPCGVVVNKETEPYKPLERYCQEHALPILLRLPYDEGVAKLTAHGEIACEQDKKTAALFRELLAKIGGAT